MYRRKLGRTSEHYWSLMKNLSVQLITHGCIKTTVSKAKELKKYFEPIITKVKQNSLHADRIALSRLHNSKNVLHLLKQVALALKDRKGGYISIKRIGFRNDSAVMVAVSLMDYKPIQKITNNLSEIQRESEHINEDSLVNDVKSSTDS